MTGLRIGIDVGGTHTDAVLMRGREVLQHVKALTTEDVESGVINALDHVLQEEGAAPSSVDAVMIGTTQFTNAVVERRQLDRVSIIRVGLPSGERIPPMVDWPDDLVSALGRDVFMIHGGRLYDGGELAPIDDGEIDRAIQQLNKSGCRNVVVSSVFSPLDASPESYVEGRIKAAIPDALVTKSSDIGKMGILERENAAMLNASLRAHADHVVEAFRRALGGRKLTCPFYVSQNDGTLMSSEFARLFPALTFSSGPTNSLRGAYILTGLEDAVVIDIGGTTSDIGVLQGGSPRESNIGIDVGGVRTNFRMPDIVAIGLGGGSLVADQGQSVGPQSVGYELVTKGLIFGGQTLTATDIAVAAGAADIGDATLVANIDQEIVANGIRSIRKTLDAGVDRMRTSREPIPVILVGGGAALVSGDLDSASRVVRPEYSGVANAIGAASAQVGAEAEQMVSFSTFDREAALTQLAAAATEKAIEAGAVPHSVTVKDVEETSVSYMAEPTARIRVKVVGDLNLSEQS